MGRLTAGLAIALLASLATNGAMGWAYLGQRDDAAQARADLGAVEQQRDGARADASACSDATDDLRTLADQRAIEAQAARAEAAAQARTHQQKADAILATPPAVPGDDCKSAQMRVDNWLKGRAQP